MSAHADLPPGRPVMRYLGGKWRMADRVIGNFPPHRTYVEPFAGGASVLLRKSRAYAEVLNDLDGEVVNLFRVLRGAGADALVRAVALTPFSRAEFDLAYEETDDAIERARRLVIRSFMGHGSLAYRRDRTTGFRRNVTRSGTTPAHDWASYPEALAAIGERLAGVVVECRPALEVIEHYAAPDVLIYADPPYVHSTRSKKRTRLAPSTGYVHEMDEDQHVDLLDRLRASPAMVIVSAYAHPIYDRALAGWRRLEIDTYADGAHPRVEVLYINPAAASAHGLFAA